jgi:hypothetical protein
MTLKLWANRRLTRLFYSGVLVSQAMPEIQLPWLVSSLPASPTHRRVALAVSIILLVAFVIAVPSARVMLPRLEIYIPLVATVMFVNDLTTASLLLAQFSIVRSRTLLLLANGYLFTALVVAVYGLIWPGAFHPTGLFGAGPQTGPWLYLVWHAGLPTSVIVYALLESKEHKMPSVAQGSVRAFIFASTTCTVLIVCGLTWFVTRFQDVLPNLVTSLDRSTEFSHVGTGAILFVSSSALVLQWRRRLRSVLDLWLSVVTLRFDLNEAINEVLVLARSAITKQAVSVQTRLAEGTAQVEGDRVQLQQVALNLVLNAVEAMGSVEEGPRELLISTEQSQVNGVLVAVRDSGPVSIQTILSAFSRLSTPRNPTESGWGCRSAVPSSMPMGAGCGQMRTNLEAPYFSSPCRARKTKS